MRKITGILISIAALSACVSRSHDGLRGGGSAANGDSTENPIVVMTYNIAANRKPNLKKLAEEIKAFQPDLVALQEVDKGTRRNPVDQTATLAKLVGMEYAYAAAQPYQGGEYGLAILTKGKINRHGSIEISDSRRPPLSKACSAAHKERRILQWVQFTGPDGRESYFMNTHMGLCDKEREAALEVIRPWLKNRQPAILVGDFNELYTDPKDTPASLAGLMAGEGFKEAGFALAEAAPQRIDWILHDDCWQPQLVREGEKTQSDHRPVLATLLPKPCQSR